ncbi:MAG: ABC transporter substrate-binding protein, partial [Lachnospiraceae bacterium]|nr:ABC transporter substrate-binding protein [Lachnospiraceae bacterium]
MKKKVLALLLAGTMALGLAACGGSTADKSGDSAATEETSKEEGGSSDTPLVVGYSPFNAKFSPFFCETAYDQDVQTMTNITLLTTDREGAVVYKGIEGETRAYNGTDYTYNGPADCVVTENEDGTVFYDFTLKDGIKFSDGEPVTIDDVIFSMYVRCDPTYDGSATLFSQPIEGMEDYRSGMSNLFKLIYDAGEDNTDFSLWTEEEQKAFWPAYKKAAEDFVGAIAQYCVDNGITKKADDISGALGAWGFSVDKKASAYEGFEAMMKQYEGDISSLSSTEVAPGGTPFSDLMEGFADYQVGVKTGKSAKSIKGIQKTGDNTLRIVATKVDATLIYQLAVEIAPLHYYGSKDLYDYDKNMFGFEKGDLSSVRAKTTEPLGAGPYVFKKYENGVVNFEANPDYFLGAPKIKYLNFREVQDVDKLNGVINGEIDVTDPSFSKDTADAIASANSNGEVSGDKIMTKTVDFLGYGYIGINANNLSVDGKAGSDESKNLRRAFATIFSVYRDVAIDSYYGEAAEVINYPISNTSWAA